MAPLSNDQADERAPVPDYDKEPVPRLPRGKGGFLTLASIFRIGMLGMLLVAVIYMRKPCADGMAKFMGQFEEKPDAGTKNPSPAVPGALPPGEYILLKGPLTEAKLQELRERAARRASDAGVNAADATAR